MSLWFKIHDEALDDPRLQRLPPATFRTWFNCLCVASRRAGTLPPLAELAFLLRTRPAVLAPRLEALRAAGLIEADAGGVLRPAQWEKRQQLREAASAEEPTSGAERTRQWRERRAAACAASRGDDDVTGDQERDEEPKDTAPAARAKIFEEFWRAFPKRVGENPEAPARAALRRALDAGASSAAIVAAAKAYAAEVQGRDPQYIASAARWLAEGRYVTAAPAAPPPRAESAGVRIDRTSPLWPAWEAHWRETKGKSPPVDGKGGWFFPSQAPPPPSVQAA